MLEAACGHGAAHHPEIIRRTLGLQLGIYRMLRQIVSVPPPDIPDLTDDWIDDLVNLPRKSL